MKINHRHFLKNLITLGCGIGLSLISVPSFSQGAPDQPADAAPYQDLATPLRPATFDAAPYVEAGYTFDSLTNNYANWNSQYLNLVVPLKENGLVYTSLQNVSRYNQVDQSLNLGYAYPLAYGVINVEGGYSANPNFLAQTQIGLGWNGKLPNNFGYIMSANQQQFSQSYANASTNMYNLGLEKFFGNFRVAYVESLSTINQQQPEYSSRFQAGWVGDNNNRLGITYAIGNEPTVVALNNLASIPFKYLQVDGLYWITKTVGITGALWHGNEGSYYQRNGGQIGLRVSF